MSRKPQPALFGPYKAFIKAFRWTRIGWIPPFEGLHHRILSHLAPDQVHFRGHRVFLDKWDSLGLSTSNHHHFEIEFLLDRIEEGDTVVDIGANIGLYSLCLAEKVGREGRVFALEPHPGNCRLLRKNLAVNGLENVTVVEKAASDVTGRAKLYIANDSDSLHRLHRSSLCRHSMEVDTIRLDDCFQDADDRISLLKLDVEGAELPVLQGASEFLRRQRRLRIFMEFAPCWMQEAGHEPQRLQDLLDENGFEIFHADERTGRVEPARLVALAKAYPPERKEVTNLWCVRPDDG